MARNKEIIFVALAAAAGAALYYGRKKKAGDKLQLLPKGLKLTGKFPSQELEFMLDVVNPSDTSLDVNAIFADVLYNNKVLGRIERTEKIIFAPLKTTKLNLPVKVSASNIPAFFSFIKNIAAGKMGVELSVKGIANAEGIETPIEEKYKLSA
jgi:LEA14-like dessication related protein